MRGRDGRGTDGTGGGLVPVHHPSAWGDGGGVCVAVRDRLTEYALGTLSHDERAFVDRHLEWCAGCRKEAAELDEAAAWVGLSAPQAEPPPELAERVAERIEAGSGRRTPWARRLRALTVATVTAVVLAVLAVGWGAAMFAKSQSDQQKAKTAEQQQRQLVVALDRVIRSLLEQQTVGQGPRDDLLRAQLTGDGPAAAGAVVYISPGQPDWALVVAANLPRSGLPYRVLLSDGHGHTIKVGTITGQQITRQGEANLAQVEHIYTKQSLRSYDRVIVADAGHGRVLTGRLDRSAPSPAAPSI